MFEPANTFCRPWKAFHFLSHSSSQKTSSSAIFMGCLAYAALLRSMFKSGERGFSWNIRMRNRILYLYPRGNCLSLLVTKKGLYFTFISPQHLFPFHASIHVPLHTFDITFYEDGGKVFSSKLFLDLEGTMEWYTKTPDFATSPYRFFFFAVNWGFWFSSMTRLRAVLSNSVLSLLHLNLTSTVPLNCHLYISHRGNCQLKVLHFLWSSSAERESTTLRIKIGGKDFLICGSIYEIKGNSALM